MRSPLPRYNFTMDPTRGLKTLPAASPEPEPESPDLATRNVLQVLTKRLAEDPTSWDGADRTAMASLFDERAASWATRDVPEPTGYPLDDALARGRVPTRGVCIEVGSGTGIQTPALVARFDAVVCIEVAEQMLRLTPPGLGIPLLTDAASLPFPDASAAAIVCVNAPLFAPEYARVLAPDGALVFVSTRGAQTPIYLAPSDVLAALQNAWRSALRRRDGAGGAGQLDRRAAGGRRGGTRPL